MRSKWQIWWKQTRPHTLTASFVPVFIGTALAFQSGPLNYSLLVAMLIASMLIQIATNNFNEYYDFKRGLDSKDSIGIGGAIVRDGIKPESVLLLSIVLYGIAGIIGLYIVLMTSWWIAVIGAISMAVGYFYTGGPYPIAYTPLGEVFAGVFMGGVIISISYYIHTAMISLEVILVSVPVAVLIGAILMANNIRDLDGDQERGRKTLAILVGRENAIKVLGAMFIVSFLWCIFLVAFNYLPFWSLLALFSIPKAFRAVNGFKGKKAPLEMMPAMKLTADTNTRYGIYYGLGIFLGSLM